MKLKYILLFCCFITCAKLINAAYEVIFERIEPASDDDKVVAFEGLRVKKFNRTSYVLNGRYHLKMPLGDDVDMMIEAFNFQGGQYKKIFDKRLDKFCKSLYIDAVQSEYEKFYAASSVKIPFGTCPYPIVDTTVTNLLISNNGLLPPYIPGGEKWRIDLRYLKKDKILGGYNVYGLVRSEQSLMQGG